MDLELNFLALEDARDFQDLLGSFYSLSIPAWPLGVAGSTHVAPLQREGDAQVQPGAELEVKSGCSGAVVHRRYPM